jgi:hypothetical protein
MIIEGNSLHMKSVHVGILPPILLFSQNSDQRFILPTTRSLLASSSSPLRPPRAATGRTASPPGTLAINRPFLLFYRPNQKP